MIRGILNFLFIWLLFASSLGYVAYQLQKPNFIITRAKQVKVYDRLANQVGSLIPAEARTDLPFTNSEIKDIVTTSLDADTFYQDSGEILNGYLDWLTGRNAHIVYDVDLTAPKSKLTAAITDKLLAKYRDLPACKSNQLRTWQATQGLPDCQLESSNVQSGDVERLFREQATSLTDQIPTSLNATTFHSTEQEQHLQANRAWTIQTLKLIKLVWLVTLGFLLIYLFLFRSKGFISLAIIFIVAGLLEIGFSLVGWEWLRRLIVDGLNSGNKEIVALGVDMISAGIEVLKTILGNLSIVNFIAGGAFLLIGIFGRVFHHSQKVDQVIQR